MNYGKKAIVQDLEGDNEELDEDEQLSEDEMNKVADRFLASNYVGDVIGSEIISIKEDIIKERKKYEK